VKLTVVSKTGKEATIAILNSGDFFGEGGLAGQNRRIGSAEAIEDCELMRIAKGAMLLALHRENKLSDMFVVYLLDRNIRYEADLVYQLFNSSEKRLARILLLLAHFGKKGKPEKVIPKISQETLAEMVVGTTRSRVSFFMTDSGSWVSLSITVSWKYTVLYSMLFSRSRPNHPRDTLPTGVVSTFLLFQIL
jgi:CRP/FNR family transcriptional regulator, cyclic AMP receptor protein